MKEIKINGRSYTFPSGTKMSTVIGDIASIDSQCRQGKCGKCLVSVENGELGSISDKERTFLDLIDLNPKDHRLLCQCTLNTESVVYSYEG